MVVVSEGFEPPELRYEIDRLQAQNALRLRWLKQVLSTEEFAAEFERTKTADERNILWNTPQEVDVMHTEDVSNLIEVSDDFQLWRGMKGILEKEREGGMLRTRVKELLGDREDIKEKSDLWKGANRILSKEENNEILRTTLQKMVFEESDPRMNLKLMLGDRELAAHFGRTVWQPKFDAHHNVQLGGIRRFVVAALNKLAGEDKVNELIENYEGRGATPCKSDEIKGLRIGKKMAELVNTGVKGGKAVVYFEGMDPVTEEPVVVDLVGVSDRNNLNNPTLYPDEVLRENGLFWQEIPRGMWERHFKDWSYGDYLSRMGKSA
ncbi:MAG: hypothetical protein ABH950_01490 [Candidatus Altiarchaeota archaeon]